MKQRPLSHRRAKAYLKKRYTQPDDWMKVARFEEDYVILRRIIDEWKQQLGWHQVAPGNVAGV